jgi:rhomboid family GlyGly-CTERM serine protease
LKFIAAGNDWRIPALLSVACLLAAASGPEGGAWLQYDRAAIASGQLWRLASGHIVHLGWPHLLLNLAGLLLVWLLVGAELSLGQWLQALLIVFAGTSAGLWLFDADLEWYVGLSGVLHGMLAAGLAGAVLRGSVEAMLIGAAVGAKLAYEQISGPLPGSEQAAGGAVVVNAHLYGFVAGGLAGLLMKRKVRKTAIKT